MVSSTTFIYNKKNSFPNLKENKGAIQKAVLL